MVYEVYKTQIGRITIVADEKAIIAIKLGRAKQYPFFTSADCRNNMPEKLQTPLIETAAMQLEEYLAGKRKQFTLPINPKGTEFQQKVWNALLAIPYGETRSYKQIAEAIGNPRACRAVGMANNKNPIPIIIPCHRVIGAGGSLAGFAGGVKMKEKLLKLEADYIS